MKTIPAILILLALASALRAQDAVTTLAGQALVSGAANGTGTNALFSDPAAIVADANGNFFVADSQNHAIRKITTNGVVTTFAGQLGVAGSANGTGTNAQFNTPSGLAFDTNGNLFVSDTGNNTIRKITPAGAVSTIAGVAGSSGFADGAAGSAQFSSPLGIVVCGERRRFRRRQRQPLHPQNFRRHGFDICGQPANLGQRGRHGHQRAVQRPGRPGV